MGIKVPEFNELGIGVEYCKAYALGGGVGLVYRV